MNPADVNEWVTLALSAGALAAAVWAWRGKVVQRFRNWLRSVKARKQNTEAMVDSWPTALTYIKGAQTRDEEMASREVRMTSEFRGLREHLESQDDKLDSIIAHQWGTLKLDPAAKFIRDAQGRNTDVNPAYAGLLRCSEANLLGYGYKNYIDLKQLASYMADVGSAFAEHRRFEGIVVMVRGDGSRFRAHVRMEPYPEDPSQGAATHWFGSVTLVEEL